MTTSNEYAGQKVQVRIPTTPGSDLDGAHETAQDALRDACAKAGCVATDIRLLSRESWTEPIGGVGPYPDMELLTYEATAARQE